MMRIVSLALGLCVLSGGALARTQQFTQGWDTFGGMLNLTSSNVTWTVSGTGDFQATYTLVGAQPSFVYQVGLHFYCQTNPGLFGRFPTGTKCNSIVRQGVQEMGTAAEFGVVLTDMNGNGSFSVDVGAVTAGTYHVEFDVRDGAGCSLIGGESNCNVIFQSPGPFGTGTTIVVP